MDRRNKVWLALLALLLVAAVAAVVVFNTRLSSTQEELKAANALLATEQEKNTTANNELSAANAIVEGLAAELTAAQEAQTSLEAELTAAQEAQTSLEAELTTAQEAQTSLEAELTTAQEAQASAEAALATAQEAQTSLAAELTAAQEAQASAEAELATAQEWALELEAQLLGSQGEDVEPGPGDLSSMYSVFTVNQATEAFNARNAELTDGAAQAQAQADELLRVLNALDENIVSLTGEEPEQAEEPEQTQEPEAPVAASGSELLVLVPDVQMPEVLNETADLDIEELYGEIDAIVMADESEMNAEEKVAALKGIRSLVGGYVNGLNDAIDDLTSQQATLAASVSGVGALESEYTSAQQNVDSLNEAIAASEASVAALEAQVAELSSQSEADSTQITELNAQIAAEQANAAALNEQLTAALAERDSYLAALEAYLIDRTPSDGEAHAASALDNRIAVAADGMSASWHYANKTVSGNSVVLSIEMDGEELYRSESIAPGAAVESFAFSRALEAGEYEAVAVTRVYSADGELVSTTRVPVTVAVE